MKYIFSLLLVSTLLLASCGTESLQPTSSETLNESSSTETPVASSDDTEINNEALVEEDSNPNVVVGGAEMTPDLDIVANALNSSDHTTLVAAVQAAGLVEALQGEGPFTVFAPVNAAFEALPDGTVETLLMPENQEMLVDILTYHVVPGEFTSDDLVDGETLTTLQGDTLEISYTDGVWYINEAQVTIADAMSSNGVTHVIDAILMPDEDDTEGADSENEE